MTRIIIHGDEEITFCSKIYGFYGYINKRTREEILLYRLYQRDKKEGEECWILLSRDKERIKRKLQNSESMKLYASSNE